jgi:hypothetical protein
MRFLAIISLFFLSFSCVNNLEKPSKKMEVKNIEKSSKSIGVIVLNEQLVDSVIFIYNEDGTLWKQFILSDDFKDKEVKPFVIKPDDLLLVFQVYGINEQKYKVKVNENTDIFKYIKIKCKTFRFEKWENHILKAFSIDFDPETNPLRVNPDEFSKTRPFKDEQFYHPIKTLGNWLLIRDDEENEHWIKWKDGNDTLLIFLYYSA